ncbi:ribosome maturation factor RimP [soil metagenome]
MLEMTHTSPSSSSESLGGALRVDRARLVAVIEPVVFAHGAEIVDVELKNESGWILRLFVEKAGSADKHATVKDAAVSLELCADVSRDLSPALDVADLIPSRYNLEVSSPGLERPLRGPRDYARFEGQKAKLRLASLVAGQKVVVGSLGPVTSTHLAVIDGSRTFEVPLADIEKANLVFEFGPAPKPGKKIAAVSPSGERRPGKK